MNFKIKENYGFITIQPPPKLVGGPLAEEMHNTLHKLIDEHKLKVIIDMSSVNTINSTGIGILISSYTTIKNAGGTLALASLSDKTQGLLSITRLNTIFPIYPSIDKAIGDLKEKNTANPV